MTRERIVGFLLGISVGTVMGFYLRPQRTDRAESTRERSEADQNKAGAGGLHRIGDRPSERGGSVTSVGGAS